MYIPGRSWSVRIFLSIVVGVGRAARACSIR
jgi:hypothetical protein